MLATRLVKTVMVASPALFALLVAFDDLVDYGSNYEFVRHTLSMDTTFPALQEEAIRRVEPAHDKRAPERQFDFR
jgi:predicted small integral membrane protein